MVEGAINVSVGGGDGSSGIPLDVLDPSTGGRLIDVEVDGASPFEIMPLGAVPYAMWREKALTVANDSVGSEQIINGSIKAEDIDPLAFSDIQGQAAEAQIPASVATDAELAAHVNSATAHPASAIVVSGSFITFVADDAQEAFQKLDQKLADEIVNRQNGQVALRTDVTALQTVTSNINNIPGILNELKIDADIARDSEVVTIIGSSPDASIPWSKVDKTGAVPGDVGAAPAVHNHDADYVNVIGGDTMAGPLQVNGDIGVTGTVDGVDVASLAAVVANKKTITGSQDIQQYNVARVIAYQGRASAPVYMFLLGGKFDQAHYTELASHTHSMGSHTHKIRINDASSSAEQYYDDPALWGIDNSVGTTQLITPTSNPWADYTTSSTVVSASNTGVAGYTLSSSRKDYLSGMEIFIDGIDRTAALLALADALNPASEDWSSFGDGNGTHPLNEFNSADPGTGYMDVSPYFSSVGLHRIEFRQTGTEGGRISWLIQID